MGNFKKQKLWFISRDIANFYPSCIMEVCLKAVGKLLDFRERKCILDALAITLTSNTCKFMGRHFTQITFGGRKSARLTDIYGAVFIDCKIEENVINKDEDRNR